MSFNVALTTFNACKKLRIARHHSDQSTNSFKKNQKKKKIYFFNLVLQEDTPAPLWLLVMSLTKQSCFKTKSSL